MNLRRFLWATFISAGVVMLVIVYMEKTREPQPAPPAPQTPAPAAATQPATTPPVAATQPAATPPVAAAPVVTTAPAGPVVTSAPATEPASAQPEWGADPQPYAEVTLGSTDKANTGFLMEVQLTNRGAAIETLKLSEHFATVADSREHKKDPASYPQKVVDDRERVAREGGSRRLLGNYVLLQRVGPEIREGDSEEDKERKRAQSTYPMSTRGIAFKDTTLKLLDGVVTHPDGRREPVWQAGPVATGTFEGTHGQRATFTARVFRYGAPYVRIEKTYFLPTNSHSLQVSLRVVNRSTGKLEYTLTQYAATGLKREGFLSDQRMLVFARVKDGKIDTQTESIGDLEDLAPGLKNRKTFGLLSYLKTLLTPHMNNLLLLSDTVISDNNSNSIIRAYTTRPCNVHTY